MRAQGQPADGTAADQGVAAETARDAANAFKVAVGEHQQVVDGGKRNQAAAQLPPGVPEQYELGLER